MGLASLLNHHYQQRRLTALLFATLWAVPLLTGAISREEAALFLEQATWGPTPELIEKVAAEGKEAFLEEQFSAPASLFPLPPEGETSMAPYQRLFFHYGVHNPDQLRQRVGYALKQILVVSAVALNRSDRMVPYINLLQENAFGNYRDLLIKVSLSPAMGDYLDNVGNQKPNPNTNSSANENYSREFLQLFTVGTELLNPDGTVQADPAGKPLPTYTEDTVKQLALAFTGWVYAPAPGQPIRARNPANYAVPMVAYEPSHDQTQKTLLDGYTLPAGRSTREDLEDAITHIFNHPNVGPFVSVRLIRSLVSSNPSPEYVSRVVAVFNNNGHGVRGDLKAVVKAILLDPEAAGKNIAAPGKTASAGHMKEPALYVLGLLRALRVSVTNESNIFRQSANMGQNVFYPPSVFNYFHLDHRLGETGLYGPELEIHTSSTSIQRANFVGLVVDRRLGTGVTYSWDDLIAIAVDADALIEELNLRLTHGSLPDAVKKVVRGFVTGTDNPSFRVNRAIYLIATSTYAMVSGERVRPMRTRTSGRQRITTHN